jgi:hypothetical protein
VEGEGKGEGMGEGLREDDADDKVDEDDDDEDDGEIDRPSEVALENSSSIRDGIEYCDWSTFASR